jgi:hypothetical protein
LESAAAVEKSFEHSVWVNVDAGGSLVQVWSFNAGKLWEWRSKVMVFWHAWVPNALQRESRAPVGVHMNAVAKLECGPCKRQPAITLTATCCQLRQRCNVAVFLLMLVLVLVLVLYILEICPPHL